MKKTIFISFFVSCFLCSWVLRAAQEDKKEATHTRLVRAASVENRQADQMFDKEKKAERPTSAPPRLEGGEESFLEEEKSPEPLVEMPWAFAPLSAARPVLARAVSPYSSPVHEEEENEIEKKKEQEEGVRFSSLSLPDLVKELLLKQENLKGVLRLSLNPFPVGLIGEFGKFITVHTLGLKGINLQEEGVINVLVKSLADFPQLKRLEIRGSERLDSFLFFLGLQLPQMKKVTEVVLDHNAVAPLGVKGFFYGLLDMTQLERLSWKNMPFDRLLPWEASKLRKTDGYPIEKVSEDGSLEPVLYVRKTPLEFFIDDALPALPNLVHLDLGGSVVFEAQDGMSRQKLMNLFDALSNLTRLQSLGLSEIRGDGFSIRALSKALVALAHNQSLQSANQKASRLQVLDLSASLGEGSILKDLEKGLEVLHHLRRLYLAQNDLSDKDITLLKNMVFSMKKLRVLDLSGNPQLTDRSLVSLKEIIEQQEHPSLKKIILTPGSFSKAKIDELRWTGVEVVLR